ncbi:hypothetical protein FG167_09890 [Lacinutrix sp. WUR7]|uniref:hypothetical protein n=1 Tax=Lacinutrix sp. WUR7 TaxID=2653681 RepID=UPI00193CE448|nr:hypothetical protein [Lacinutrix sp. WUR7]QRM89527.1 hypothetical protein FG167_09890 [Lacinutrix sp. WUR7]
MLDFLKIKITNAQTRSYFWEHSLLYFHSESEVLLFDNETIKTKKVKQYRGLLFEFTKNALFIRFKPHYYFNSNEHNANDFSVANCIETLKNVFNSFCVDLEHLEIINIEFGINIVIPIQLIDIRDLLCQIIYHGQNQFATHSKYRHCRYSNSVNKSGMTNVYKIIKAYAKCIQFPNYTSTNTFRFEAKSNRKKYINSLGIFTIQDLFNTPVYDKLSEVILKEFDEVLIIDEHAKPKLSETKFRNFEKKLNPLTWNRLLMKSKNTFRRNINSYYNALNTCDTHLKKEIKKLMIDKLNHLKKCAVLSIYIDEISTQINSSNLKA